MTLSQFLKLLVLKDNWWIGGLLSKLNDQCRLGAITRKVPGGLFKSWSLTECTGH